MKIKDDQSSLVPPPTDTALDSNECVNDEVAPIQTSLAEKGGDHVENENKLGANISSEGGDEDDVGDDEVLHPRKTELSLKTPVQMRMPPTESELLDDEEENIEAEDTEGAPISLAPSPIDSDGSISIGIVSGTTISSTIQEEELD